MQTVSVTFHEARKYRIDENKLPEKTRDRTYQFFGCARKVYNLYVDFLYGKLEERGFVNGRIPDDIRFPEVSSFKKQEQYKYLKHADSLALCNAKIAFESAVKRYNEEYDHISYTKKALRNEKSGTAPVTFRGLKGMPKFHSRHKGDFSYTTDCQEATPGNTLKQDTIRLEGDILHLPKKMDFPLIMHRPFADNVQVGKVTICMEGDGHLYASISYSYTLEMPVNLREAALSHDESVLPGLKSIGLDYSQPYFYVDSNGQKANVPHAFRKYEKKLAKLQKQLARMDLHSKNYEKKLAQIKRLYHHIANLRKDFAHKESTRLAKEYDFVTVEDINLRAMGECLGFGKNLHDNAFGMFRDFLAYKLKKKGSVLVKVDRFYPSTKTCHECGHINKEVVLGMAEWTCPECGAHLCRDINAAQNIRDEGIRTFLEYFAAKIAEEEGSRRKADNFHNARKQGKKNEKDKKEKAA